MSGRSLFLVVATGILLDECREQSLANGLRMMEDPELSG